MVSMTLTFSVFCSAEDSSTKSTDNIFKKFLEVAVKDEHHRLLPTKGKHSPSHSKDLENPAPRKKTVIVVEEDSGKKNVVLNSNAEQKLPSILSEVEKKTTPSRYHESKTVSDDAPKPEVQSELTFETPISASFLLKPLSPKKEISLTRAEIKEIGEELKALEKISKDLESLRSRFQTTLKRLQGPEKEEKETKPPTDLLNYNFIEVTETGQPEKK